MTPPEPMAAGPAPGAPDANAGAIYDIGYRGYDGPRLGRQAAVWALFIASLRAAFGLGRSGRAKIVPFGALGFASLPAVVQSAILATAGPVASRVGPGITYDNYLWSSGILAVIFLAAQAPELLGSDLRNRVLTLYFSHALERIDYAMAKLAAMVVGLLIVTVFPLLILFLGQTFAAADLFAGFRDQLGYLPEIVGSGLVYALLLATVGMAISAFTPRRAYATAAIVAVFLVGQALQALLRQAGTGDWSLLLAINAIAEGVRYSVFGGAANGPVAGADLPSFAYLVTAAAVVIGGVGIYTWRYQRIQP
jgi:ABC-2 type transport system permease protein